MRTLLYYFLQQTLFKNNMKKGMSKGHEIRIQMQIQLHCILLSCPYSCLIESVTRKDLYILLIIAYEISTLLLKRWRCIVK